MPQEFIEYSVFSHHSGTYFNLTKVNHYEVFSFWSDVAKGKNHRDPKTGLGASAFAQALDYYGSNDVWVAYVSNREKSTHRHQIEMCVTITIGDLFVGGEKVEQSFASNMGIFRNLDYTGSKHRQISMELHGFAAKAMSEIYKNMKFMINFPLDNMLKIMESKAKDKDKVCSIYRKGKNGDDNNISISYDSKDITLEYEGETFSLKYTGHNDDWFFGNKCMVPQLDPAYNIAMAVIPTTDLIGCSHFEDTVIVGEIE